MISPMVFLLTLVLLASPIYPHLSPPLPLAHDLSCTGVEGRIFLFHLTFLTYTGGVRDARLRIAMRDRAARLGLSGLPRPFTTAPSAAVVTTNFASAACFTAVSAA